MSGKASSSRLPPVKQRKSRTKRDSKKFKSSSKPVRALGQLQMVGAWNPVDFSGWDAPLKPSGDPKAWDHHQRVDLLRDIIPFWRAGILAAEEGGEVEKWKDFYERLEGGTEGRSDGWGPAADDPWGGNVADGWGPPEGEQALGRGVADGWGPTVDERAWGAVADPRSPKDSKLGDWDNRPIEKTGHLGLSSDETARTLSNEREIGRERIEPGWGSGDMDEASKRNSWTFVETVARQEDASPARTQGMHQFYAMPTQDKMKKIEEVVQFLRVHA